jgi:methylated-DNA-protein-cysteine methyltransferase-like protein
VTDRSPSSELSPFERAVAAVIESVPAGQVVSYGDVAAEAGYPGAARAVGSFLRRHDGYPWWRVVTASGRLVPGEEVRQQALLAVEGVVVVDGHVRSEAAS